MIARFWSGRSLGRGSGGGSATSGRSAAPQPGSGLLCPRTAVGLPALRASAYRLFHGERGVPHQVRHHDQSDLRRLGPPGNGIAPLWVTGDASSEIIDRAPWTRVDDVPWQRIVSPLAMIVRGGVRHLQIWKCTATSERSCPEAGSPCGKFHSGWFLPALCVPQERATALDELVVTSADGEHVAVRVRNIPLPSPQPSGADAPSVRPRTCRHRDGTWLPRMGDRTVHALRGADSPIRPVERPRLRQLPGHSLEQVAGQRRGRRHEPPERPTRPGQQYHHGQLCWMIG